ncbi:hypothetical protein ACA910_014871 [Epithemia clementina (nom. ined.)]
MTSPAAAFRSSSSDHEDDRSESTNVIINRTIDQRGEVKEYVVKFLFKPTASGKNTEVASTHFAVLQAIQEIYPETTIFDNFGNTLSKIQALKSYDAYLRHFKLQYVKPNETKKRGAIYMCFHRIRSSVPISEIRRHSTIATLLSKVNTRLTVHQWSEDDTRISTLGFHVGVDPSNFLKEHFEEKVRSQISQATGRAKKHIPRFQCGFSSPFFVDAHGHRTSTKSYDIQCRQKDAKDLIQLLRQTYHNSPTFVFHKLRHHDANAYKQAIRAQNRFLSNSRIVPIQGIDEDLMFYLEQDLLQVPGVQAILHHKDTATKGRWSLLTTTSHFRPLTAQLRENLERWVAHYSDEIPANPNLPPPGLAFHNSSSDSQSDHSYQSYFSSCSSMYTLQDESFDDPPQLAGPVSQAWGPPPSSLRTLTPSPVSSGVSQDEFDHVTQENARLARKVDELTDQVKSLLAQMNTQHMTRSFAAPTHGPPTPDLQAIIAATTQAVLAQLSQSHTASESATPRDGDISYDSMDQQDE